MMGSGKDVGRFYNLSLLCLYLIQISAISGSHLLWLMEYSLRRTFSPQIGLIHVLSHISTQVSC